MNIPKHIYEELARLTKEAKPNEVAAFLFDDNTRVVKVETSEESIGHFIGDIYALREIQKQGVPSALFHSHPCEAVPSSMDLAYMHSTIAIWGCPWLIMSDKMKLRAWTMRGNILLPVEEEVNII